MLLEIGIPVFVFTILISRYLNERASKSLSNKELKILNYAYAKIRKIGAVIISLIAVGFWLLLSRIGMNTIIASLVYFLLISVSGIYLQTQVHGFSADLDLSDSDVRSLIYSRVTQFAGLVVLLYLMILNFR